MSSHSDPAPAPSSPSPFSITAVWSDAAAEIRRNAFPLFRAVLIPAVAIAALDLVAQPIDDGGVVQVSPVVRFVAGLVSMVIGVVLAVSCHRIVLRDVRALGNRWGVYFDRRAGAYLLTLLGLVLLFVAALVCLGVLPVLASTAYPIAGFGVLTAAVVVCLYGLLRLSLVLPARAIGEAASFEAVIEWTRGRSFRVVFASAFPLFVLGLLLGPLDVLVSAGPERFAFRILPTAIAALCGGVLGAVLLSCTYRAVRPPGGRRHPRRDERGDA